MRSIIVFVMVLLVAGASFATGQSEEGGSSGEVTTVRWWDWSDSYADYIRAQFEAFETANPDIEIDYSLYTIDQFRNNIQLAIRSGDVPDVFPRPGGVSFAETVEEEWYVPLDPYIEEIWPGGLSAFVERFPETSFVEGINVWDGEVYHAPFKYPAGHSALLFYNKDLFRQAGLDPDQPPETWSELREYAERITAIGEGEKFGIIMGGNQLNRWEATLTALTQTAAPIGVGDNYRTGLNYQTGEYDFHNPAMVDAMNLILGMRDDGSYYPGFLSLNAPQARSLFGLGNAGFMFQGQWNVAVWKSENPDLDFGVAFPPVPDSGREGYVHRGPVAATGEQFGLSAQSENPSAAARVLLNYYTDEWVEGYVRTGDGFGVFPSANVSENFPYPELAQIFELSVAEMRVAPDPTLRDPEAVSAVVAEITAPSPGIRELAQGAFAGAVDYATAAEELSSAMNAELNRAIEAVRADGTDVSRDLWSFPDWDPMTDYTGD
jgi:multiple sugar transport system substrate-binding protein